MHSAQSSPLAGLPWGCSAVWCVPVQALLPSTMPNTSAGANLTDAALRAVGLATQVGSGCFCFPPIHPTIHTEPAVAARRDWQQGAGVGADPAAACMCATCSPPQAWPVSDSVAAPVGGALSLTLLVLPPAVVRSHQPLGTAMPLHAPCAGIICLLRGWELAPGLQSIPQVSGAQSFCGSPPQAVDVAFHNADRVTAKANISQEVIRRALQPSDIPGLERRHSWFVP